MRDKKRHASSVLKLVCLLTILTQDSPQEDLSQRPAFTVSAGLAMAI